MSKHGALILAIVAALAGTRADAGTRDRWLEVWTSAGCGACVEMAPTVDALRAEGYRIGTASADQYGEIADAREVKALPTTLLLVPGGRGWREAGRIEGVATRAELLGLLLRGEVGPDVPPAPASAQAYKLVVIVHPEKQADFGDLKRASTKAIEAGYKVVFADWETNWNNARHQPWIRQFDIREMPFYVLHRGHEIVEVTSGRVLSPREVGSWIAGVESGQQVYRKSKAQAHLAAADRVYYRRRLAPGSCGMLGCVAHGGGLVLDRVTLPAAPSGVEVPAGRQ